MLAAHPSFLSDYREGASGLPSEYRIRRLTAEGIGSGTCRCSARACGRDDRDPAMTAARWPRIAPGVHDGEHPLGHSRGARQDALRELEGFSDATSHRPGNPPLVPAVAEREYRSRDRSDFKPPSSLTSTGDRERGFNLLRRHGVERPTTRIVETGRGGGFHVWFAHPGAVVTPKPCEGAGGRGCSNRRAGATVESRWVPPSVQVEREAVPLHRALQGSVASLARSIDETAGGTAAQERSVRADDGNAARNARVEKTLTEVNVEVIQRHGVVIQKEAEDRYRGLCPFHHNTTPSFVVTPSMGCSFFGCEAAGNAVQFVQRLRGIDVADATRSLR